MLIEYNDNSDSICFTSKFERIDVKGFERNKDGTLKPTKVIDSALRKFRDYVETLLRYDEDKWLEEYGEE